MSWYISGHYVSLTNHAIERATERFKSLSIVFPDDNGYLELTRRAIQQVLDNPFMDRYLSNLYNSKHSNENVLVYDKVNKMVYALAVKPYQSRIVVKTIGTELDNTEWLYDNRHQRLCWIYKDVFKFSTSNGNVTWN